LALIQQTRAENPTFPIRTLVTGATGLVGRHLLSFGLSLGIRAALRTSSVNRLACGESVVVGNIDDATDWSEALVGVDSIVHLAAQVHVMKPTTADRAKFESVNVAGTSRLATLAAQAGVKRFIFLSSVKVNGETSGSGAFRSDDPANPGDDYARSKLEAERELTRIGSSTGMETVFIRAPLVYGPGVRANFLRLLSWAHRSLPLPLASIENSRSLVSVWNLCDLILTVLRHPQPINGALMVSDGHDVSTSQLIHLLAEALHRPVRLFSVPLGMLRAASRLTGTSDELERLCSSLRVDITATRNILGWSPPQLLEVGLSKTANWYLSTLRRS
jgi:nucleoside-diphosphate-sugar epimerase